MYFEKNPFGFYVENQWEGARVDREEPGLLHQSGGEKMVAWPWLGERESEAVDMSETYLESHIGLGVDLVWDSDAR